MGGMWVGCLYKCIRSILSDGLRDERNGECGGTGLTCVAVLLKKRGEGGSATRDDERLVGGRERIPDGAELALSDTVSSLKMKKIDSGGSLSSPIPVKNLAHLIMASTLLLTGRSEFNFVTI